MKILIIDDNEVILDSIMSFLKRHGYDILYAANGAYALKILEENSVNLIITDLMMPDMDGYEFCQMIRHNKKFKNLPIIVSTAKSDHESREFLQKLEVKNFLTKPYSSESLLNAVKGCLS